MILKKSVVFNLLDNIEYFIFFQKGVRYTKQCFYPINPNPLFLSESDRHYKISYPWFFFFYHLKALSPKSCFLCYIWHCSPSFLGNKSLLFWNFLAFVTIVANSVFRKTGDMPIEIICPWDYWNESMKNNYTTKNKWQW